MGKIQLKKRLIMYRVKNNDFSFFCPLKGVERLAELKGCINP